MLSRVADSLYWMSRYLERAENIARLLDVNLQLLLDFEDLTDESVSQHWEPLIAASGDHESFKELYDQCTGQCVTDFLTFNRRNSGSILSSVFAARENARMIRDQIPADLWEEINRLYLKLKAANAGEVWRRGPYEFYAEIRSASQLIQGLVDNTFPHEEGYAFMRIGRFLERAEKTARIVDLKYHILLPNVKDVGGAVDTAQWIAVLKSCSAFDAYHKLFVGEVLPWNVADFLLLSKTFPRSVRFCVGRVEEGLRSLSGTSEGYFSNPAEKQAGRLLSDLNYSAIDDIFAEGLHEWLESLQERLAKVSDGIFKQYMFTPPVDMATEIRQQQQQQQQLIAARTALR